MALRGIAGHNTLEALAFEVEVYYYEPGNAIGSTIQKVEKVLVKPGWSALRQVSFKVSIIWYEEEKFAELSKELQSLPDKYLSHLSKMESIAFDYSYFIAER